VASGGIDFFSGTVESVRRTLKSLSADADWPDRSARPGLLPECVSTGWPRVRPTYTRTFARTRVYTLEYARERAPDPYSRGGIESRTSA